MSQIVDPREAKLKYGELLRQQMKFDNEKKKLQKLESIKTPKIENVLSFQNQREYNQYGYQGTPQAQPSIDKKEMLQKQMEAGDFFPFGKRRIQEEIKVTQAPSTLPINTYNYQQNQQSQPYPYQQPTIPSPRAMPSNSYLYPQNYYRQASYPNQQSVRANYHSGQDGYLQINSSQLQNNSMSYSPAKQNPISMPSSSNALPYHAHHDDSPNKKRNLLKYQNITQAQLIKEQLQKQKLQNFLKIQMQEAANRKQQQKLKMMRENQKLQQDNRRYQEQMLRKQSEQLMEKKRKQEAQRQKEEEYKRNLEKAQQNAINSKKKPVVRGGNMSLDNASFKDQNISLVNQKTEIKREEVRKYDVQEQKSFSKKNPFAEISVYSEQKESEMYAQARLKNQTDRRNQEKYFQMIKKDVDNIRSQIISQSQMYKLEMEKIKIDAQKARFQKEKSEYEFLKLKNQYDKTKNDQKLKFALEKTNDYYEEDRLRRRNERVHTQKNYSMQPTKVTQRMTTQRSYEDGIKSLAGDSVKILLPRQNQIKNTIKYNSIPYEQYEPANNYRSQYPPKESYDSLDNFVKNEHINAGKWNTLSSVDSQITYQIQRFLQQQRSPIEYSQQRDDYNPQSNISSVGKMLLRNRPYESDGLNSLDYGKINLNNNKRLERLRNVDNEDGDLDRLDNLLNNY